MLWYQCFSCKGSIEETLEKLEGVVARMNLKRQVPDSFVQVLSRGKHHGSEEFLLYVGIESAAYRHIPDRVRACLNAADVGEQGGPCTAEEAKCIKRDWDRDHEGRVIYRRPPETACPAYVEAWAEAEPASGDEEAEQRLLVRTQAHDRLLALLSARGQGTWDFFHRAFVALTPAGEEPRPSAVLRGLGLLGHVVVSPDRSHWRGLPPLLVRMPEDESGPATEATPAEDGEAPALPIRGTSPGEGVSYLLCGQRDAVLLEALQAAGSYCQVPQPAGSGPSAVRVLMPRDAAPPAGLPVCENYLACVEALPTLDQWRTSLKRVSDLPVYEYQFRLFEGREFRMVPFQGTSGLYELWTLPHPSEAQRRLHTLYYDAESDSWLSGDWYGLRFLSHLSRGWHGPLIHREDPCPSMILPETGRPPEIYERALVLCSGLLPARQCTRDGDLVLVYNSVPLSVARVVAGKLGVCLQQQTPSLLTEEMPTYA